MAPPKRSKAVKSKTTKPAKPEDPQESKDGIVRSDDEDFDLEDFGDESWESLTKKWPSAGITAAIEVVYQANARAVTASDAKEQPATDIDFLKFDVAPTLESLTTTIREHASPFLGGDPNLWKITVLIANAGRNRHFSVKTTLNTTTMPAFFRRILVTKKEGSIFVTGPKKGAAKDQPPMLASSSSSSSSPAKRGGQMVILPHDLTGVSEDVKLKARKIREHWWCHDAQCTNPTKLLGNEACWLDEEGVHVSVTSRRRYVWAIAIGTSGVTVRTPPTSEPEFQTPYTKPFYDPTGGSTCKDKRALDDDEDTQHSEEEVQIVDAPLRKKKGRTSQGRRQALVDLTGESSSNIAPYRMGPSMDLDAFAIRYDVPIIVIKALKASGYTKTDKLKRLDMDRDMAERALEEKKVPMLERARFMDALDDWKADTSGDQEKAAEELVAPGTTIAGSGTAARAGSDRLRSAVSSNSVVTGPEAVDGTAEK